MAKFKLILLFIALWSFGAYAENKIIQLRDNIYRVQSDNHFSIFILGKKKVFLTDPLGEKAAKWLLAEIKRKFGARKIEYVFYSHNHWDHVGGGEVFDKGNPTFISHAKAKEDLVRQKAPTKIPNLTFSKKMEIDFEGEKIELIYYGRNNGRGNSVLYMPEKKFLFAVDWMLLKRLPWVEMHYYDLDGMIDSLREVLKLDFDLVSPGHSVVGDKSDAREFLAYLTELRAEVLKAMTDGKSLEQMQEEIKMSKYKHFAKYKDWLKANIKGVYQQMEQASGRYGQER